MDTIKDMKNCRRCGGYMRLDNKTDICVECRRARKEAKKKYRAKQSEEQNGAGE